MPTKKNTYNHNNGELHLFILWQRALNLSDYVIEDLSRKFTLLKVAKVSWSPRKFSENLSRFYGQKLPPGSGKEQHCGTGPFLLLVVLDHVPRYEPRPTSKGLDIVNINTFDAKMLYRQWAGGGHRIHATNNPREAEHDLCLLLGINRTDFLGQNNGAWEGEIEEIAQDMVGANGWHDLSQLFYVLNSTVNYVVLRNFDSLPHKMPDARHSDIDLLTDNQHELRYITRAIPLFREPYRVLHKVDIGGQQVLFDFRYVGDNYFDPKWASDILNRRVFHEGGFYVPNAKDHFYSLLYHGTVHKPALSEDYRARLLSLNRELAVPDLDQRLANEAGQKSILDQHMRRHGYSYKEPDDLSVYFNSNFLQNNPVPFKRIISKSHTIEQACKKVLNELSKVHGPTAHEHLDPELPYPQFAYYLSRNRALVLRSFPFENYGSVLLCYFGSGPMVNYLAQRCKIVHAIELEEEIAEITAYQSKMYHNVQVGFQGPDELNREYDAIFMMLSPYVLEYLHRKSWDIGAILESGTNLIKPHGIIGFCYEAKFALNDFIVGNWQQNRNPAKSSLDLHRYCKSQIRDMLKELGWNAQLFLHMYPDLYFPKVLATDEIVSFSKESIAQWIASAHIGSFQTANSPPFGYSLLYSEAAKDGLLTHVSNSMMVLTAKEAHHLPNLNWKIISFSGGTRNEAFQTYTYLSSEEKSSIVIKQGKAKSGDIFSFNPNFTSELYEGELLEIKLLKYIRSGARNSFLSTLKEYIQFLITNFSSHPKPPSQKLPFPMVPLNGKAFDAIPRNIIYSAGTLKVFDLEWAVKTHIPLCLVLYRGLLNLFFTLSIEELVKQLRLNHLYPIHSLNDLIWVVMDLVGFGEWISRSIVDNMSKVEEAFQHWVRHGSEDRVSERVKEFINSLSGNYKNLGIKSQSQGLFTKDNRMSAAVISNHGPVIKPKRNPPKSVRYQTLCDIVFFHSKLISEIQHPLGPSRKIQVHHLQYKAEEPPGALLNTALEVAKGLFVLFSRSDIVLTNACIRHVLAKVQDIPAAGIIIMKPTAFSLEGECHSHTKSGAFNCHRPYIPIKAWFDLARNKSLATSSCFLIKRELLNLIGGFDTRYETLEAALEDFRIRAASSGYGTWLARDLALPVSGKPPFSLFPSKDIPANLNDTERFRSKWRIPEKEWPNSFDQMTLSTRLSDSTFQFFPPSILTKAPFLLLEENLIHKGESHFASGNYRKAEKFFLSALGLNPSSSETYNNLFCLYWTTGNKGKALGFLKKAMEISPSDPDVLWNYFQYLFEEKKLSEADVLLKSLESMKEEDDSLLLLIEKIKDSFPEKTPFKAQIL